MSISESEALRKEYNTNADKYEKWCQEDLSMQKLAYYSTIAELEKEGIEGKTFLEVGCGPCPIGQRLAKLGVKKIICLDISSEMLERAQKNLTDLNLIDKFEFICCDLFNENVQLREKVDCVVAPFLLDTCIENYEMLAKFFSLCVALIKDDGFLFVTDIYWVRFPQNGFWLGWYNTFGTKDTDSPKEFESFNFYINTAPDHAFKIYNVPSYLLFKAGHSAAWFHSH